MHSQIQCPVCTLYLHVGMNLHVHLDTHPKDQVIRALVNMTVLQSNEEVEEPVNQMQCSRYAPLQDETIVACGDSATANAEPPSLQSNDLDNISKFHETPVSTPTISPSNQSTNIQHLTPLSITRPTPLPPPPPYDDYLKLVGPKDPRTPARISTQSTSTEIPNQSCEAFEYIESNLGQSDGASYNFDNFQIIYEPQSLVDADNNQEDLAMTDGSREIDPQYQHCEYVEEFGNELPSESDDLSSITNSEIANRTIDACGDRPPAMVETIAHWTRSRAVKPKNRRPSNGLHVLSDVTLAPEISITSIINVNTLTENCDRINLTDMVPRSQSNKSLSSSAGLSSFIKKRRLSRSAIMTINESNPIIQHNVMEGNLELPTSFSLIKKRRSSRNSINQNVPMESSTDKLNASSNDASTSASIKRRRSSRNLLVANVECSAVDELSLANLTVEDSEISAVKSLELIHEPSTSSGLSTLIKKRRSSKNTYANESCATNSKNVTFDNEILSKRDVKLFTEPSSSAEQSGAIKKRRSSRNTLMPLDNLAVGDRELVKGKATESVQVPSTSSGWSSLIKKRRSSRNTLVPNNECSDSRTASDNLNIDNEEPKLIPANEVVQDSDTLNGKKKRRPSRNTQIDLDEHTVGDPEQQKDEINPLESDGDEIVARDIGLDSLSGEHETYPRNIVILKTTNLSPKSNSTKTPKSAATSVIRMASSPNKLPTSSTAPAIENRPASPPIESTCPLSPQPSTSKQSLKALVKQPFVKTPKKLIVKFKTPFVPVIEEEANLQPPDHSSTEFIASSQCDDDPPKELKFPMHDATTALDSYPFSPFRQSFTPGPEPIVEFSDNNDNKCSPNLSVKNEEIPTTMFQTVESVNHLNEFPYELKADDIKPDTGEDHATFKASSQYPTPVPSTSRDNSFLNYSANHLIEPEVEGVPYNFYASAYSAPPCSMTATHRDSPPRNGWPHCLSPQYMPYEAEKTSYTNLDDCKTHSRNSSFDGGDHRTAANTTSSDSVNIRTDEQMPAKGEISEQESNGDVDGSWSQQAFPLQNTLPRYTSSYDTTVARESWSLSNVSSESSTSRSCGPLQTVMPTFPASSPFKENDPVDIKPNIIEDFQNQLSSIGIAGPSNQPSNNSSKSTELKVRRFRCFVCPNVYLSLKQKRAHLSEVHQIQPPVRRNRRTSATVTTITTNNTAELEPIVDSPSESNLPSIDEIKSEAVPSPTVAKKTTSRRLLKISSMPNTRYSKLNLHLLNYNWTVLRDRLLNDNTDDHDFKLPMIPTETNTFICMVCNSIFKSVRSFDEHMAIHPSECYTCGREFRHWYNFSIHLKRHLNIKDYHCKHCPKRFASRPNLAEHMTMHNPEARLQCKICYRRFRRHSNLIMHRKREHLNIKPRKKDYICWCGDVFHSKAKIAWHRETHEKVPKCCPYCRERFVHRNSLSRHIRISHTDHFQPGSGSEMVACTVCSKKFLKTSLKLHMVTHDPNPETNGALEYACTICNKSFTTKWNLKQHKWVHASRSSKPFRCTLCPKAFVRESDFTTHVHTHKAIKPYTCDHCGLQFVRKYNWLRHTREHEKPKGHKCEDCGKIFHRAYYLKEHRRTHTGERPFECVICGKTSTTKTNHNKHVKIHHARDPLPAET